MSKRKLTIEEIDKQRDDLCRQLHKIDGKLDELWRLKKRLLKKAEREDLDRQRGTVPFAQPELLGEAIREAAQDAAKTDPAFAAKLNDPLDIPVCLRRAPVHAADEAAIAEIAAKMEEQQKAKARGRIAKLKAKQSGDTKKMPLQGKEALAAIREAL